MAGLIIVLDARTSLRRFPGFMKTEEVIEITSDNQRNCQRPLFVTLVVSWECTPPRHISTVDPSAKRR